MIHLGRPPCDEGVIRAAPDVAGCARRDKPWVLATAILGSSMAFIDGSVVNVALPAIRADLAGTVAAAQWIVNGYLLMLGALILVGGSAGDGFGRRRVFALGVVVFTAASVACGVASGHVDLRGNGSGERIMCRAHDQAAAAQVMRGSLLRFRQSGPRMRRV